MSTARLELLGGFAISGAGSAAVPIRISSKKAVALVAYLAMRPNRSAGREQLATLLWGDRFDKQARHSLRECLRQLRMDVASIAPDLLHFGGDKIGLPAHALALDVDEFATLARSGASFFARRSVRESPGIVTSHRQLVVNSMLAGEGREAKAALDVLLRLVPGTSLGKISEALPYSRDSDRSRFLDAFARVGL